MIDNYDAKELFLSCIENKKDVILDLGNGFFVYFNGEERFSVRKKERTDYNLPLNHGIQYFALKLQNDIILRSLIENVLKDTGPEISEIASCSWFYFSLEKLKKIEFLDQYTVVFFT